MSFKKGNTEQSSKTQLYQTKTVSEKNISGKNNDMTHLLHLNKYFIESNVEELEKYIHEEKIYDSEEIAIAIKKLLEKYDPTNKNFYKMLDILLKRKWPINKVLEISQKDYPKFLIFEENKPKQKITLLTLAIKLEDEEFVKTVLNHHNIETINMPDPYNIYPVFYSILFNKKDQTTILSSLIQNGANLNQIYKFEEGPNKGEQHTIFTLACLKNLPNVIKLLIDNPQIYPNFAITPTADTGLHICARGGMEKALKILLDSDRIDPNRINAENKKAQEVVIDNEKKNEIIKLFVNYSMKKNEMNNNSSMQKNNSQYGNMNLMNKKNSNNEQINLNNMNHDLNNNINNNNKNDEYKNYLNNKNNNLLINKNMSNMNNNPQPNQLIQNLNMENMNPNESSDFSEEQGKNNSNKNIKYQKMNMNQNNISLNKTQINPRILNQNMYNNLIPNSKNTFNLEIPVVMENKNKVHYRVGNRELSNFLIPKSNSIPILNLDMNDKTFKLELEINELTAQISEIEKESKKIEEEIRKDDEEINAKKNDLAKKGARLKQFNTDIVNCNQELETLKETQENILAQIPEGKVYKGTNKNGNKKLLKFSLNEIEDNEMFKILNKDLLDYQLYKSEIISKQNNALQIENRINEIKNIVKNLTQEYEVNIYGSYALGLNMDWSDIDLVLVKNENQENVENNNNNNNEDNNNILLMQQNGNINELQNDNISVANTDSTRESVLLNLNNNNAYQNQINNSNILEFLSQKLNNLDWVKSIKFRENLEVRILRAECIVNLQPEPKLFYIDISVETEKHLGLKCVTLINNYLKEYPVLKPITIALRAILHSANLHLPEKGGLSAYGLILMVVSYIQSQKEYFTKNDPYLCGKIFYGFLRHYGIMFDFNKYLILTYIGNESGYNNGDKESFLNLNQYGQEFIILDPLNNNNNVASKSFQFMNLKMAFMIAYMVTKEDCDCGCHFGEAEFENSFQSTEHCYLKRMLNSVRRFQG